MTRKKQRKRILPHNMAATIGITYMHLSSLVGDRASFYRGRAVRMAEVLRDDLHLKPGRQGRPYVVWHYVADDTRMEDADHALAELRFALLMNEENLVFSDETILMMLTTWFHQGLNDDECLTHRIDGSDMSARTRLEDVVARSLFLLRYDAELFRKMTAVE